MFNDVSVVQVLIYLTAGVVLGFITTEIWDWIRSWL